MNTRKFKKATKWLQRKFQAKGITVSTEQAEQAIAECAYVEESYGCPGVRLTPHGAAVHIKLLEFYRADLYR